MNNLQSSASPRFNTFTSLSSREKFSGQTKPQVLAKMKSNATTLSPYIASTLMAVDHQRIGRRIMGHPHNKNSKAPPLTRDSINTTKGADQRTGAVVMAEAHILSDLRTTCTMTMRWTIAPKIVPFSKSPKKWIKTAQKLHNNLHPDKSTTPYNGTLTTNTHHLILLSFHHRKPTKPIKPHL
jgi:hypothetical protein